MSMLDACDDKFKCYGGGSPSCIDWDKVCDGKMDCKDKSDELECQSISFDPTYLKICPHLHYLKNPPHAQLLIISPPCIKI